MQIDSAIAQALSVASVKKHLTADSIMCVGLSAGMDSTVLLHALVRYFSNISPSPKLKAIHVHHGLSSYADDWALQAEQLCRDLSMQFSMIVECCIEKVHLENTSEGVEQAARFARYQVFEQHCRADDLLFQGHHLDDQIETFFMRAVRGSGLMGLSSIPAQRNLSREHHCQIVRPFLSLEKSELLHYAQQQKLSWVEDESNQDSNIERNWWRNELLPQVWRYYCEKNTSYSANKKKSLLRTINNVQQEHAMLTQIIQKDIASKQNESDQNTLVERILARFPSIDIDFLPVGFEAAYVRAWLSQHVDLLPSAEQMRSICVDVIASDINADPCFMWAGTILRRYRGRLFLLPQKLSLETVFDIQRSDEQQSVATSQNRECVSRACLLNKQYVQRYFLPGDKIKLAKRPLRKLKKYWQELGVPSWLREVWPILVDPDSDQVVLVFGLLTAESIMCDVSDDEKVACIFKVYLNF